MPIEVACKGPFFQVVWALDSNGQAPGRDFFNSLTAKEKTRIIVLFTRLANEGKILNREHFKQLGDLAKGDARSLFEFKRHQVRFIGGYLPNRIFAVANGCRKKKDNLDEETIAKALRVFDEFKRALAAD